MVFVDMPFMLAQSTATAIYAKSKAMSGSEGWSRTAVNTCAYMAPPWCGLRPPSRSKFVNAISMAWQQGAALILVSEYSDIVGTDSFHALGECLVVHNQFTILDQRVEATPQASAIPEKVFDAVFATKYRGKRRNLTISQSKTWLS